MHHYSCAGLTLQSEIALPGLYEGPGGSDVLIRTGSVPDALDDAELSGPTWYFTPDRFLLRVPDRCRFLIERGRTITVALDEGIPASEVAIYITGTVMGILLHQRSKIVLHASAVMVGERAVMFLGASGAGKSTIAAALNARGYPLIADDVTALSFDSGTPFVLPDGRNLKLWRQTAETLGLRYGAAVSTEIDKHYVEPETARRDPVPLGAVYALKQAASPGDEGIFVVNGADATATLGLNAYRPAMVECLNQTGAYFSAALKIANSADVFLLSREMRYEKLEPLLDRLQAHWIEIGLSAEADRQTHRPLGSGTSNGKAWNSPSILPQVTPMARTRLHEA